MDDWHLVSIEITLSRISQYVLSGNTHFVLRGALSSLTTYILPGNLVQDETEAVFDYSALHLNERQRQLLALVQAGDRVVLEFRVSERIPEGLLSDVRRA